VDIILEVDHGNQSQKLVRYACHKVELAKASKRFQDMMRKQELKVFVAGLSLGHKAIVIVV
jgi:hypothetical protein